MMHFFGAGAPFEMLLLHIFSVAVKYREDVYHVGEIFHSMLLSAHVAKIQQAK